MSSSSDKTSNTEKGPFWRKYSKSVPNSWSSNGDNMASSSSFQHFAQSTSDAWDVGDDDALFTTMEDVKLVRSVVQSAAESVINNHKTGRLPPLLSTSAPPTAPSRPARFDMSSSRSGFSTPRRKPYSATNGDISAEKRAEMILKFKQCLFAPNTDLEQLRALSWRGVPEEVRPLVWKILAGYLPASLERREAVLKQKREQYAMLVQTYYETRSDEQHQETYRQIHIDIPRMSPLVPLFQQPVVQQMFERILYIWAIRHPASGYVQGMNDLVTPFFVVFLTECIPEDADVGSYDVSRVDVNRLDEVEADSFCCMSELLNSIQDNYTFAQPGIQSNVKNLQELIKRINMPLHNHLVNHGVEFLQFTFRWMNNLLMRELPLHCTIRLWDTYMSEPHGFSRFHLYVCVAFLNSFSDQLLDEKDFQGLMLHLQNLPTANWGDSQIELLVAEAYRLKVTFADAPMHLQVPS